MTAPANVLTSPVAGSAASADVATVAVSPVAPQARVIHSLKQWMDEGRLSPGSPLPSERVLSEQFSVNRGTVRRALQVLQDEGFLRTQNGRIRIVTSRSRQNEGALRNSVALLTPLISDRPATNNQSGRLEFIGRGTLKGIRDIGKHAMSLNPDLLADDEVEYLASQNPYGVVITDLPRSQTRPVDLAKRFRELGVNVAVYGDSADLATFDRVTSDHASGAYQLTQFLLAQGRRRIAMLTTAPLERYWMAQRVRGYERAMREAGLEPLPPIAMAPFPESHGDRETFERGVRGTVGYLVEHLVGANAADALMVTTDSDYFGVAAACRLCGKEPQHDVLISGYDNYWTEDENRALETTVPCATVDKMNETLGVELVRLLQDRAEGRLDKAPERREVPPRLVVTS